MNGQTPYRGVGMIGRRRRLSVASFQLLDAIRLGDELFVPDRVYGGVHVQKLAPLIVATGLIDAEEQAVADHYLGGSALAAPDANTHVALFETNPNDAGAGATETAYTGYGRVNLTNNATNWPAATGGAPTLKSNGVVITFGQNTGGSVTINGFGIFSLTTGGSLRLFGTISPGVTINTNDTPEFGIGDLDFQIGDPGDTF